MVDMHFLNANTGFIIYAGSNDLSVLRSMNSGINWSSIYSQIVPYGFDNVYFISDNTGYIWGSQGIKKTTNGSNWSDALFFPVANVTELCFVNLNTGFINGINTFNSSNCIGKTTDQGSNWVATNISQSCKRIEFIDAQTGYALCNNSIVLKTTNSGISWNTINIQPTENLLSISFTNSNTGYILTSSAKILKTINGGVNWTVQNLPAGNLSVREVEFASTNRGIVLCSGGTILKTTTGGEITGIYQTGNNIPDEYSLSQNYPNPFNPSTQIKFDIPTSSFVNLIVYDALGSEVAELVNEQLKPGSYLIDWNAEAYPSGIYFYKLFTDDFIQTHKMVLIK
jgi:photosystem II stability/assembly factor-like uncharacterized protein